MVRLCAAEKPLRSPAGFGKGLHILAVVLAVFICEEPTTTKITTPPARTPINIKMIKTPPPPKKLESPPAVQRKKKKPRELGPEWGNVDCKAPIVNGSCRSMDCNHCGMNFTGNAARMYTFLAVLYTL